MRGLDGRSRRVRGWVTVLAAGLSAAVAWAAFGPAAVSAQEAPGSLQVSAEGTAGAIEEGAGGCAFRVVASAAPASGATEGAAGGTAECVLPDEAVAAGAPFRSLSGQVSRFGSLATEGPASVSLSGSAVAVGAEGEATEGLGFVVALRDGEGGAGGFALVVLDAYVGGWGDATEGDGHYVLAERPVATGGITISFEPPTPPEELPEGEPEPTEPEPTDGETEPTEGEPEPTDGEAEPTEGEPEPSPDPRPRPIDPAPRPNVTPAPSREAPLPTTSPAPAESGDRKRSRELDRSSKDNASSARLASRARRPATPWSAEIAGRSGPVGEFRVPRSGTAGSTAMLMSLLTGVGRSREPALEDILSVVGPFPVAGLAWWQDDWHAYRCCPSPHPHRGIDIFAARGTPTVAAADGHVSQKVRSPISGLAVEITDSAGTEYFYAHLDGFAPGIEVGDRVRTGDVLGYVGDTGNAKGTSAHLHFEVQPGGVAVPPLPYLERWLPIAEEKARRLLQDRGDRRGEQDAPTWVALAEQLVADTSEEIAADLEPPVAALPVGEALPAAQPASAIHPVERASAGVSVAFASSMFLLLLIAPGITAGRRQSRPRRSSSR